MKKHLVVARICLLVSGVAGGLLVPGLAWAQSREESRWGSEEARAEARSLVLTRRADNHAYGTSAFSFTMATQDPVAHRNYVDLVFNGCGLLHFNPVGGMKSRVADLGENELDVAVDEDGKRTWATAAFHPVKGHVYLQEIRSPFQTMTVKFRIDDLERDEMAISWTIVREPEGRVPRRGMAGTMGQCGGQHGAR